MPLIRPGDTVKLTNEGSERLVVGWNNRYWTTEPGKSSHVPVEAVINAFGDPRASTATQYHAPEKEGTGLIPDRKSEIRRLAQLHGLEVTDLHAHISGERDSGRPIPKIKVEDLNGERLYTVIEDMDGTRTIPAPSPTLAMASAQDELLSHLQKQVDFLSSQLDSKSSKSSFDELPADEINPPTTPPTSTSQKPSSDKSDKSDKITLP